MDQISREPAQDDAASHKAELGLSTAGSSQRSQHEDVSAKSTQNPDDHAKISKTAWVTAIATVVIAFATIAYVRYAKKQWSSMNGQLKVMQDQLTELKNEYPELVKSANAAETAAAAAKDAAKVAGSQLELSERPWVSANLTPASPLIFDSSGAHLSFEISVTNIGRSPAENVTIDVPKIIAFCRTCPDAVIEQKSQCKDTETISSRPVVSSIVPYTVFPGPPVPDNRTYISRISRKELSRGEVGNSKMVVLAVVGCIDYKFSFAPGHHQTGISFMLLAPGGIYLGRDVPKSDLRLFKFGTTIAN